jgi:hypothetical protein
MTPGHSESQPADTMEPLVALFMEELHRRYFCPLWNFVQDHQLEDVVPGFLLNPEQIILYVGRTHIAIEYLGSESLKNLPAKMDLPVVCHDYSKVDCNLFEKIVGFSMDSNTESPFQMIRFIQDWVLPTSHGLQKLTELNWNFLAQNMALVFNHPLPIPPPNRHMRVVNSLFFDADDSGLRTRHIKWLDFFPILFDDTDSEVDSFRINLRPVAQFVESDARFRYPLPDDFKYQKLQKLNRFIELWANSGTSEPQITAHLSVPENQFILSMRFGATAIHPELIC